MAISTAMCTSFKVELMKALHNFQVAGNTFKIALFTSSASLGAATTAYGTTNEVVGTGYSAGGKTLTNIDPTSAGTTAFADFADVNWTAASFTARGAQIYNSTNGNRSVSIHNFGSDLTVISGTFTIQFPTPDGSNAILRLT